jgi:hypothetical protein
VIALGRRGKSLHQIAEALDVSVQTLANWRDSHPEFLEAVTRARELSQAWWEDVGQKALWERSFNSNLWALQVRNRFPESYRDTHRIELKEQPAKVTTNLTFEQTLEALSRLGPLPPEVMIRGVQESGSP